MSDLRFTISPVPPRPVPCIARRGFTFTEVLFAVMLLGIGFIMVAAIFPVAIQQSKASRDDTAGIIVAKAGGKIMESLQFTVHELRHNGGYSIDDWDLVRPFDDWFTAPSAIKQSLFSKVKGNLISKADPRYAWVPVGYKLSQPMKQPGMNVAEPSSYTVYIVAVACRNKSTYDEATDVNRGPSANKAAFTFQPKEVYFRIKDGGLDPDIIQFSSKGNGFSPYDQPAAAEGAFVLVANDQYNSNHRRFREANGRIYRLGVKRPDLGVGTWELAPGRDMTDKWEDIPSFDAPKSNKPAIGYMIGRGYSDPSNLKSPLEGPAQDLFAMPVMISFPQ